MRMELACRSRAQVVEPPRAGPPYTPGMREQGTARPGGSRGAPAVARSPAHPATVFARILVRGADGLIRALTRALGASATAGREGISGAELRDLVAANVTLTGEERRIIDEVLVAGSRCVSEVMVPRPDVVFLDAAQPIAEAAGRIRELRHSRYPVVDGSHDDVVGVVHLRELLIRPDGDAARLVADLVRDVKRLPGGKRVVAALAEMRREGHHLAVVVDEYGGTDGIVTLEDLVEELVGEVYDTDRPPPQAPADGAPAEVEGRLNLADFAEHTGVALPAGPYETVGGFLMARLGRLPVVGDEVALTPPARDIVPGEREPEAPPWRLVVVRLDGRRVDRVHLVRGAVTDPAASHPDGPEGAAATAGPVGHDDPHATAAPVE